MMVTKASAASCLSWLLYGIGGLLLLIAGIGWFSPGNPRTFVPFVIAFACFAIGLLFDLLAEIVMALYRLENNETGDFEAVPTEESDS